MGAGQTREIPVRRRKGKVRGEKRRAKQNGTMRKGTEINLKKII